MSSQLTDGSRLLSFSLFPSPLSLSNSSIDTHIVLLRSGFFHVRNDVQLPVHYLPILQTKLRHVYNVSVALLCCGLLFTITTTTAEERYHICPSLFCR